MPDEQTITDRVKARAEADEVADLAQSVADGLTGSSGVYEYWKRLVTRVAVAGATGPNKLTPAELDPRRDVMTDSQARAFGNVLFSFGLHKGKRVDEVPLDYLVWLVEQKDPFKEQLARYVKSRRVQSEQADLE